MSEFQLSKVRLVAEVVTVPHQREAVESGYATSLPG